MGIYKFFGQLESGIIYLSIVSLTKCRQCEMFINNDKTFGMKMDGKKLEYVRCNLCGADDSRLLFIKGGFRIVRCKKCGLVYINPRLKASVLNELYNKDVISPYKYFLENIKEDKKTFEERIKLIGGHKKPGKLLDVGCSVGTFLDTARKNKWDAYGIDVNKASSKYCREKLKLRVKTGVLENGDFKKESFDAIVMSDLIEHLPDPLSTLKLANSLLKKKGLLFITTPDIGSWLARLTGGRWQGIKPNEHLYYFSKRTIAKALRKSGFRVVRYSVLSRVRNLKTIVHKSEDYSKTLSIILKFFIKDSFSRHISFRLKFGDEMTVFAEKM